MAFFSQWKIHTLYSLYTPHCWPRRHFAISCKPLRGGGQSRERRFAMVQKDRFQTPESIDSTASRSRHSPARGFGLPVHRGPQGQDASCPQVIHIPCPGTPLSAPFFCVSVASILTLDYLHTRKPAQSFTCLLAHLFTHLLTHSLALTLSLTRSHSLTRPLVRSQATSLIFLHTVPPFPSLVGK